VLQHRENLINAHPADDALVDEALRCALTHLLTGERPVPPAGSDAALRYVRDRVNVPRDMSLWAARRLRAALEATAALAGPQQGPPIPEQHRRDQDPRPFRARA
jgi:glutathione S-transferase